MVSPEIIVCLLAVYCLSDPGAVEELHCFSLKSLLGLLAMNEVQRGSRAGGG